MPDGLRFVIRTPAAVVVDEMVAGGRVPTASGQAGLRPRGEPLVTVVLPGLCLFRSAGHVRFAATAGGLLDASRDRVVLYTPFAVAGDRGEDVLAALDRALVVPGGELAARRRLGELEQNIVRELRQRPPVSRTRRTDA